MALCKTSLLALLIHSYGTNMLQHQLPSLCRTTTLKLVKKIAFDNICLVSGSKVLILNDVMLKNGFYSSDKTI